MDDSLEALRREAKTGDAQAALRLFWAEARANGPRTQLNFPQYPYMVGIGDDLLAITPQDHNHIKIAMNRNLEVPLYVEALKREELFSELRADYYYIDDEFQWQPFDFQQMETAKREWEANPLTWAQQHIAMRVSGDFLSNIHGRIGDIAAPVGRRRASERPPINSVRKFTVNHYFKVLITDWARAHARELKQAGIIAANNRLRELCFKVNQLREQLTTAENQIASNIIYEENNS